MAIYIAQLLYKYFTVLHCYYPGFINGAATQALEGIRRNKFLPDTHLPHLGRGRIVDKMQVSNGIQTHDPLITSREHQPLHHSAPNYATESRHMNEWLID